MAGIGHRGFMGRNKGVAPCSLDTDAFVSATGISGSDEAALRALAAGLEADGLCSKIVALYPIIGGTASAHSYNLKNTAAYQVTWNGTVTHDANGCKSDGSTGWGDTGCIIDLSNPDFSENFDGAGISAFSKDVYSASSKYIMGATLGARTDIAPLVSTASGGRAYMPCQHTANPNINGVGNSQGFYTTTTVPVASAFNTDPFNTYKNGVFIMSAGNNHVAPTSSIGLLCRHTASPIDFFDQYATNFIIHKFLDATQAANLYSRIQTFETAIGR